MSAPLVSILIPVYNVEPFLPKCLDTVIGQTYKNLQIVLIDDGSKDGSWKIMQEYAAKDARIEIYHQENQGVATTRNHLLEKIKGEYVLFVDSDDWVEGEMVEFMVGQLLANDAEIVTCANIVNDCPISKSKATAEVWGRPKVIFEFLRHANFNGSLCNKLIKTSLLHNEKFNCEISYGEDALFCWQVLQNVTNVIVTDKQLYHYRMNETSLSHRKWTPNGKGSGHETWEKISEETMRLWPQYSDIAIGNFAIADMWNIFFAAKDCYKFDNYILQYQKNVRRHFDIIRKEKLVNGKKLLFAYIAARSYRMAKVMAKFI